MKKINLLVSIICIAFTVPVVAQDTVSYYQTYIDREKKYLNLLLDCKSESAFFSTAAQIKANSLVWNYLPFFHPLDRRNILVSSGFGYRMHPITGKFKFHKGIDIPAVCGTIVLASGSGYIIDAGYDPIIGNFIKIGHSFKWTSLYGHLSQINVSKGQKVTAGQMIGLSGTTGRSTGCHLHYAIYYNKQAVAPLKYIKLFKECLRYN
ncbi:MAG: M23 family metallopeptidase [Chitinophagaceae bacterium]|nr:M23 family metallopeptidase [Chitinophagaceae bacterium]